MERNEILSILTQAYFKEIQEARRARMAWQVQDARESITRSNGILMAADALGVCREQVIEKYKEMETRSYGFQTIHKGGDRRRAR